MSSNLAGLGVIYNDNAGLNQTIFQLNAVPGSLSLVHVDGRIINPSTYTIEESILTFDTPPAAGAWIYVVSGQGGTFIPQSYVDQAVAPKPSKTYVDTKLNGKADKGGGFAFTGPIEVPEPTEQMHPVTLQLFETLGNVASPEYVDNKTNDKVTQIAFDATLENLVSEDQKGASNGIPDLDGNGDIKIAQVPELVLMREHKFYASGGIVAATSAQTWWPRSKGFIKASLAYASTAPTGADIIIDLKKNGVSIHSNAANRLVIPSGSNKGELIFDVTPTFDRGDRIHYDVVQVGSTEAGSGLTVQLEYVIVP